MKAGYEWGNIANMADEVNGQGDIVAFLICEEKICGVTFH